MRNRDFLRQEIVARVRFCCECTCGLRLMVRITAANCPKCAKGDADEISDYLGVHVSYEERFLAVKLYRKYGRSLKATVRELGYPTENSLKAWCAV